MVSREPRGGLQGHCHLFFAWFTCFALLALLSWRSPFLPQPSLSDKYSFHTQFSPCSVNTFLEMSLGSITMVSLSLRFGIYPPPPPPFITVDEVFNTIICILLAGSPRS